MRHWKTKTQVIKDAKPINIISKEHDPENPPIRKQKDKQNEETISEAKFTKNLHDLKGTETRKQEYAPLLLDHAKYRKKKNYEDLLSEMVQARRWQKNYRRRKRTMFSPESKAVHSCHAEPIITLCDAVVGKLTDGSTALYYTYELRV